jgi:tRNA A-37 threonylcarbamoyl transferase component Bud32
MTGSPPVPVTPAPLLRGTLCHAETRLLKKGGWANAEVSAIALDGAQWVVKDFSRKIWLVRQTIGRYLIRREWRALLRLQGVPGIPARPFRMDGFGLGYLFVEGQTLSRVRERREPLGPDFFTALEDLVGRIHRRGYAHLDLRNGKNILVTPDNRPQLIDFQAGLWIQRLPGQLRAALEDIDHSGVYKWWNRFDPESLDEGRRQVLETINRRRRRYWPFNRSWSKVRGAGSAPTGKPSA